MTFAESIPLKLNIMHYVFMDARCTEFCADRLKNVGKMGVDLVCFLIVCLKMTLRCRNM
jgi:hypothetical protein